MKFDVLTLFPAMLDSPMRESIIGKAINRELLHVNVHK
jgi:tRNA (guanine37-N1)-methyltransferase